MAEQRKTPRETTPSKIETREITLAQNDDWADLGAGPLMIMPTATIRFAISDDTPALADTSGFRLGAMQVLAIKTYSHVWVSAVASGEAAVYVAPVEG